MKPFKQVFGCSGCDHKCRISVMVSFPLCTTIFEEFDSCILFNDKNIKIGNYKGKWYRK